MVAQGLAVKRLDLVRAMVLSNTATRIGTRAIWEAHIAEVRAGNMEAIADATIERWFSPKFRRLPESALWRAMLARQPSEGYIGCAAAIAGTDFYATTATLTLPTLVIAGSEDRTTPPDLVRETADLIRGARSHLIRGAGHLPCVEKPAEYAGLLTRFLDDIAHLSR
jgi:3-oxoadipate enol-lactonase